MEYGTGVYTGVLPYHSGGNVEPYGTKSRVRSEQPVHFGLMFNVQRLLGDRIGAVVDAMQPGGSGDPFSTLSLHEREELSNLYRLGFPRGDRSEEHTSELHSLMRNQDAVFSLKK